ncbi:DUF2281 domain-containing protein [Microcoleus sp. AT8-B1]|uniref:DUF2281 domain-containing protein n=1 Tax=unclassified Microcoleus TaxID=2642155 RepID=UPI002FD5B80C
MAETINVEQSVLENLRQLPTEKQQEVLDFAQFLVQKASHKKQLSSESSESNSSSITEPTLKLSLREIASLPIAERHKILAAFIPATAEDFLTYPELTEFSVLDGEEYLIEKCYTRSHDAFLKGYAPEDEGLYDDYSTFV